MEKTDTDKAALRAEELRGRAEEALKKIENEVAVIPDERVRRLVHELKVHQIELEMQNEELRQAQEELEESRSKYSYLFNFAPVGYFTLDREGVVLETNLTGANQLRYERRVLIGKPFAVHTQNGHVRGFHSHLKKVIESGEKQSAEVTIRRKDGSKFDARLESIASEYSGNIQCLTAVVDITEIKRAEQNLRQSERRFRALIEKTGELILVIDAHGTITYCSLGRNNVLGYANEELVGRNALEFVHPADISLRKEAFRKCFSRPEAIEQTETRIRAKDGTWRWISAVAANLLGDAAVNGIVVNGRDITEHKRAEDALKDLTARLRRSNSELEQFAYSASHDMREPLRTIAGFLKLLERRYKGKLDERADEYIDFTIEGVTRLDMLLRDLSEFARLDTKVRKLKPVSAAAALEQAIHDLGAAIEECGAEITYDPLPMVMVNESHMVRLFQNLLGNSIKFRKDGKLRIHVSAEQKEDEWVFSVRDNGIGIDPKFFERIFVVFQRLHTKEEYAGTGMGLAMCKKIVELHGGRIWVEAEPGKGATFFFTLPVMKESGND